MHSETERERQSNGRERPLGRRLDDPVCVCALTTARGRRERVWAIERGETVKGKGAESRVEREHCLVRITGGGARE